MIILLFISKIMFQFVPPSPRPEKDAAQEKMMTKLRQENNVDELLRAQSKFFIVQDALVSKVVSYTEYINPQITLCKDVQ